MKQPVKNEVRQRQIYTSTDIESYVHIEIPTKNNDDVKINDEKDVEDFSCLPACFLMPRILTRLPKTVVKRPGGRFQVVCLATVLFPTEISWYANNGLKILPSADKRVTFQNNARQLTINDLKLSDAGKITCIARNKFGHDTCYCTLEILM